MKKHEHLISAVEPGSIAEELELAPGDVLLSIDGNEILDIFDYRYYIRESELTLLVRKADGEEWELDIEKDEDDDLGITFASGLMDDYRSCSNRCIFCFIDQLPKGMRETLYFKDDDARLSFLQGNYVTLTNMREEDIDRIIRYRLEPINVSVHATNPELRVRMLGNRFAGQVLARMERLKDAGIRMNAQIVLCRGWNDGEELARTIRELAALRPELQSVSVVPVGLTRYREGLTPLEPFTKEDALAVLHTIHTAQEQYAAEDGNHFIHAGDEWYLLADTDVPPAESYDGYLQLENGVGMMRLLMDEFREALDAEEPAHDLSGKGALVCGTAIAPLMGKMAEEVREKFPGLSVQVCPIRNDFFGERITVSGLLTGQDIIAQMKGRDIGGRLLLTRNMLRYGEDVLLDDLTIADIEKALGVPVTVIGSGGEELLQGFRACLHPETAQSSHS